MSGLQWNGVSFRSMGFLVSDRPRFRSSPTQQYTTPPRFMKPTALVGEKLILQREGSLTGLLKGRTPALTETALDSLKLLFAIGGVLKDVSPGGNTRQISVVSQGEVAVNAASKNGTAYQLSVPLLAVDPFWEATSSTVVTLSSAGPFFATALGNAPSYPVIVLTAPTNPVLTYRNSVAATIHTLGFTITLTGVDKLTIDMSTGRITKTIAGVTTNAISAKTSGDFPFALDPADGVSPDISTSSGTGTVTYTKRYL
jgi:hypothetical protein